MDDKIPPEAERAAREPPLEEEEPDVAAALTFALAPEQIRFDGPEPGPLPDPFVATPREQEMGRLEDRISELRVEAARAAEERAALADRLAAALAALDDARGRIAELEALAARHEQRVVKAYQRLQADDRLRQRARRALRIGLGLLEAGAISPDDAPRDGDDESSTPK
jgi:hypothetical protein